MLKWKWPRSLSMPSTRKAPSDQQYEQAIKNVFSTMSGEFFMEWLERECSFWETTLVPGDPIETAINESRRSLLLQIKHIVIEDMAQENDDGRSSSSTRDPDGRITVRS